MMIDILLFALLISNLVNICKRRKNLAISIISISFALLFFGLICFFEDLIFKIALQNSSPTIEQDIIIELELFKFYFFSAKVFCIISVFVGLINFPINYKMLITPIYNLIKKILNKTKNRIQIFYLELKKIIIKNINNLKTKSIKGR